MWESSQYGFENILKENNGTKVHNFYILFSYYFKLHLIVYITSYTLRYRGTSLPMQPLRNAHGQTSARQCSLHLKQLFRNVIFNTSFDIIMANSLARYPSIHLMKPSEKSEKSHINLLSKFKFFVSISDMVYICVVFMRCKSFRGSVGELGHSWVFR